MNTLPLSGRILCFGEVMLRLTPAASGEMLMQSSCMTVRPGGAEANVAVSLARLGAPAALATILPDNVLGHAARDEMRRHGVDTSSVLFRPGRMGLYFLTPGAVRRPSEVLYDRSGSAFVEHVQTAFDWDSLLDGADWLHVSGVTPATGPAGSAAAVALAEHAAARGISISYDGNFRSKLWAEWGGEPASTLGRIMACATVAFADERDFALILGRTFEAAERSDRCRQAAEAAFEAFPRLQRIASTHRAQDTVSDQTLSAAMMVRADRGIAEFQAAPIHMAGVIDRVGGGDAFAAAVLFGLLNSWADQTTLAFGLAAAGLKHSVLGDFNLFSQSDVQAAMSDHGFDIRR